MPDNRLDWLLLLTALAYELLMAAILLAQRLDRLALRDRLGRLWFWLVFPALATITGAYIRTRRPNASLSGLASRCSLYMIVEWLLDIRYNIPFRDRWPIHNPPYPTRVRSPVFSHPLGLYNVGETAGRLVGSGSS